VKLAVRSDLGETLQTIELTPSTFSTGSRGYRANTKVQENGKRYQCNIQMVEIGSKPDNGDKPAKKGK
jgi:hypothetical protein